MKPLKINLFFNRQGEPITIDEYTDLLLDNEYKIVKQEDIKGMFVSTVWIGIDHNYGRGNPLIFETMIFDQIAVLEKAAQKEWAESYCDRYSSDKEAIAGHDKAVEYVKDNQT